MTARHDGLAAVSAAAGITRTEALGLWEEVKANSATLAKCSRHDFPEPQPMQRRITCRACGGWADTSAVIWYQRGLAHGAIT